MACPGYTVAVSKDGSHDVIVSFLHWHTLSGSDENGAELTRIEDVIFIMSVTMILGQFFTRQRSMSPPYSTLPARLHYCP